MNWKRNFPIFLGLVAAVVLFRSGVLPSADEPAGATLSVFDIGQGDAILITTPHRQRILIDGGPDGAVLTRLGEAMRFHERTIDLVIVSHNHADHITGLNRILDRYDVKKIWLTGAIHTTNEYVSMHKKIKDRLIPTEVVWANSSETTDGVSFDVIHPLTNSTDLRPDDQHDATIVVRACFKLVCALLTGDIDEGHEGAILDSGQPVEAHLFKVAHHGSKTGLAPEFLTAVKPSVAIISVSAENSFGHPAPSILNKLKNANVETFRTDQNGTVTCNLALPIVCRPDRPSR